MAKKEPIKAVQKNKGGAPPKNTNAEKWTEAEVLKELAEIEAIARKPECLWLGNALVQRGLYKDIYTYWTKKFKRNMVVFLSIKRINQIFEDKLFTNALNSKHNATIAIFGLKNNHGWVDKNETDITTGGQPLPPPTNLANATDEDLAKLAEVLTKLGGSTEGTGKA